MAAKKRNNSSVRWGVLLASALAALGFWTGIVNGPQPADAGSPTVAVSQPAPNQSPFQSQVSRRRSSPSFAPQPQFSAPAPRFRTRGS